MLKTSHRVKNVKKNCDGNGDQSTENLPPTRRGKDVSSSRSSQFDDTSLRLKGQMIFVPECGRLMFLCSPRYFKCKDIVAKQFILRMHFELSNRFEICEVMCLRFNVLFFALFLWFDACGYFAVAKRHNQN